jgi:hypothetical protein
MHPVSMSVVALGEGLHFDMALLLPVGSSP